jgi:hypothetical protein
MLQAVPNGRESREYPRNLTQRISLPESPFFWEQLAFFFLQAPGFSVITSTDLTYSRDAGDNIRLFKFMIPHQLRLRPRRLCDLCAGLTIPLCCFGNIIPVFVRTLGWEMPGLRDILEALGRAAIRALRRNPCDIAWPSSSLCELPRAIFLGCASCAASWFITLPGPGCICVVFKEVVLTDLRSRRSNLPLFGLCLSKGSWSAMNLLFAPLLPQDSGLFASNKSASASIRGTWSRTHCTRVR